MQQYKLIYRRYDFSRLTEQATGDKGGSHGEQEAGDWSEALNKHAGVGWTVKHSGTVNSGRDIIFWALLERGVSERPRASVRKGSDSSTER